MDERNPICAALIQEDPNHLTWFYTGKFVGNVTVISVLSFLFRIRFLHARVIAFAVAGFQILLTTYLCFSDPITGLLDFGGLCSHDPLRYRKSVDSLVLHVFAMLVLGSIVIISYFGLQTQRTADRSVQMEPQRRFVGVLR